jgi:hypothetical protein
VVPDTETILAAIGVGALAGGLLQVGWHLSGWAPAPASVDDP